MNNNISKSKELAILINDELLLPIRAAHEHMSQLEALFKAISGMESKHHDIKLLADIGAYIAFDISNWLDGMHESARDEHVPKILSAII